MEILCKHPKIWEKIAPNGTFDTRACHHFIKSMGGPSISAGKQCILYLTEHLNEFLQEIESREAFEALGKESQQEMGEMEKQPLEEQPLEKQPLEQNFNTHSVLLPLIDQCEYSLEAEALERLTACIHACYKTDRGIILLENDLLLYQDVDESYKDTWYIETCNEWKDRLHSSLVEEFCTALGLWMVSK